VKKYLLPETGNFYKANLHCHSTLSDGRKTPEELKELYKRLGYSVLAYTDHDIFIPHDELQDADFLPLNGFEAEINENDRGAWENKCCHICFIALEQDQRVQPCWHREKYLFANAPKYRDQVQFDENAPDFEREYTGEGINRMMKTAREKGFFVTYNHPSWSKEHYPHYSRYEEMHAFEIMNGSCLAGGYDDYNPRVYDDFLFQGKRIYCIGADDNHNGAPEDSPYFDSGLAFTMIKADALEYRKITKALEDGHFYASQGPEIHALWLEDGKVHIQCSPAAKITCCYALRRDRAAYPQGDQPLTQASFPVEMIDGYFRITVTDEKGRHACTNAYFVDEVLK